MQKFSKYIFRRKR